MIADLTGQVYGRLTVLGRGGKHKAHRLWRCSCSCGQTTEALGTNLKRGATTSCGCFRRELARERGKRQVRHGDARDTVAAVPEHRAWTDMKQRCLNPANRFYPYYGGRGIGVCERWLAYENFLSDMGRRPGPKHSIDRIDVNGNYCHENCRWATKDVQQHNVRARSSTGVLGVGWDERRQRFTWGIARHGQQLRGRTKTIEEAKAALLRAEQQLYGDIA